MDHVTPAGWLQILSCLGFGCFFCWALIGCILKRAESGLGSTRERDFHHGNERPIPRLGGVAMAGTFVVIALAIAFCTGMPASSVSMLGTIVFTSLAMFTLGLWDDLRSLSAKFKFAGQIGIATVVYCSNIRIELFRDPFTGSDIALGPFGYVATVFWLVGLTNLINLIDGIDGLAGGICLMLMLLMANLGVSGDLGFTVLLSVGVAGALIGFLKFNYPPARIYMGDGGAYFLGFLIGILSIVNSNKGTVAAALIAPAFALALPIVDVGLASLRRAARGLPIFRPDQKHIHHHLLTLGISRERTLLNLYTVSLLCLFLALCVFCVQGRLLPLYTGLLFLVLLIAGHLSGFTKNWYRMTSQLGQSFRLRKETHYALTLDRWFALEACRRESLDDLWEDFRFVARKLGFSQMLLTLPNGVAHSWRAENFDPREDGQYQAVHEMSDGTVIELGANKAVMSEVLFELLGDLAAETWYKAASGFRARARKTSEAVARAGGKGLPDFKPFRKKTAVALAEWAKP